MGHEGPRSIWDFKSAALYGFLQQARMNKKVHEAYRESICTIFNSNGIL
jgi:hypothetical protein